jgi:DNA repair photolyase
MDLDLTMKRWMAAKRAKDFGINFMLFVDPCCPMVDDGFKEVYLAVDYATKVVESYLKTQNFTENDATEATKEAIKSARGDE